MSAACSAASVAGHADERATTGRVRELYFERLGRRLLEGAPPDVLADAAERAGWDPPQTLTAVLVPESEARAAMAALDARTLRLPGELAGADDATLAKWRPRIEALPGFHARAELLPMESRAAA